MAVTKVLVRFTQSIGVNRMPNLMGTLEYGAIKARRRFGGAYQKEAPDFCALKKLTKERGDASKADGVSTEALRLAAPIVLPAGKYFTRWDIHVY